jgi:hypothetical protein
VAGNQILDPSGRKFVIKGIDAVYGAWAGGDCNGFGATNLANYQRDIANAHNAGMNLVRLDTNDTGNACKSLSTVLSELDRVVTYTNSLGIVAEISQESSDAGVNAWLAQIARHYAANPMVWIKLANEPFCGGALCSDWAHWQSQHQQWDNTVRANGYQGPVVLNCVGWSWDCSGYPTHSLTDPNVILGTHRYANGNTAFTAAELASVQSAWANLSRTYAVMVDELGNFDFPGPGGAGSDIWNRGILTFLTGWVNTQGGAGVIAFNQYWSDGNSMTNSGGSWNTWGQTYLDYFVKLVP